MQKKSKFQEHGSSARAFRQLLVDFYAGGTDEGQDSKFYLQRYSDVGALWLKATYESLYTCSQQPNDFFELDYQNLFHRPMDTNSTHDPWMKYIRGLLPSIKWRIVRFKCSEYSVWSFS